MMMRTMMTSLLPIRDLSSLISVSLLLLLLHHSGEALLCSQCSSEESPDCEWNPPPPTNCTHCSQKDPATKHCLQYKHYNHCVTVAKFINDTQLMYTRACSPLPMSDMCSYGKEDLNTVKVCYTHCNTDGCNIATSHHHHHYSLYYYLYYYTVLLLLHTL
ncbi:hypothetical protein Ahia01_001285900 [Argonauta hians]